MSDDADSTCFVIMPISTPVDLVDVYRGDGDHFLHVYEHVFKPAIRNAGYEPTPPFSIGSEIIHADIVQQLEAAPLVLCDLSSLNPNVLFELGIRTALDKPVCLVRDEQTSSMPFDTAMINCHTYSSSMDPWTAEAEVAAMSAHVRATVNRADGRNALWRYFGLTQRAVPPEESDPIERKLDLLLSETLSRRSREAEDDHSRRKGTRTLTLPRSGAISSPNEQFERLALVVADEVSAELAPHWVNDATVVFALNGYEITQEQKRRIARIGGIYGYDVSFVGERESETDADEDF